MTLLAGPSRIDTSREGGTKFLLKDHIPGYVIKIIKSHIIQENIDTQLDLLEKAYQYFGNHIPETFFGYNKKDTTYVIVQKEIEGSLLKNLCMEDVHIQHLHDLQSIILSYINYIDKTGDLIDFKGSDEAIFHEHTHSFFKKILHVLYDQTKIYSLFTNPRHSTNLMADHEHVWLVDVVNPRKREEQKNMLGAYRSYYLTWRNFIYKKALSLHLAKIKKRIAFLQQQYTTEYVNPPADL